MVWLYILLGISVALNIGLGVALYKLHKKHSKTAQQLHLYNVCAGGMHCD
ncbi:MAG: hypothetical protein IJ419_07310 [Agathobacter sp.]|nr:hypothetical protein [Agathobacter sp.]